jgi:hypothetical protein
MIGRHESPGAIGVTVDAVFCVPLPSELGKSDFDPARIGRSKKLKRRQSAALQNGLMPISLLFRWLS